MQPKQPEFTYFLLLVLYLDLLLAQKTTPVCSIHSCADCHFENVCETAGCQWDDTVPPNGPIPWCTPKTTPPAVLCDSIRPCNGLRWPTSNFSIRCVGDHVCDRTSFTCSDSGTCTLETTGTATDITINAHDSHAMNVVCHGKCSNVHVQCPKYGTCTCTGCSASVQMECFHGTGASCTLGGATAIARWESNTVWCKSPPPIQGYSYYGALPAYCPTSRHVAFPCQTFYPRPSSYITAPNHKCAAFNYTYYDSYRKTMRHFIEVFSCGIVINISQPDIQFATPICVEYVHGKPVWNTTVQPNATTIVHCNHTGRGADSEFLNEVIVYGFIVCMVALCACCTIRACCKQKIQCCNREWCSVCHWGGCVKILFYKCGWEDLYDTLEEVMEMVDCCCCTKEIEEEEEEHNAEETRHRTDNTNTHPTEETVIEMHDRKTATI